MNRERNKGFYALPYPTISNFNHVLSQTSFPKSIPIDCSSSCRLREHFKTVSLPITFSLEQQSMLLRSSLVPYTLERQGALQLRLNMLVADTLASQLNCHTIVCSLRNFPQCHYYAICLQWFYAENSLMEFLALLTESLTMLALGESSSIKKAPGVGG